MQNINEVTLDKKLLKSYASEGKLAEKIALLLKQQEAEKEKRIELEKTHLYKEYAVYDISLEEYTKIVRKALTDYTGLKNEKKADVQDDKVKENAETKAKFDEKKSNQNPVKTNNFNLNKKENGDKNEKKNM